MSRASYLRLIKQIEGFFALSLVASILLFSVLSLILFNPKVDEALVTGAVAGVNTEQISSPELEIYESYDYSAHHVFFEHSKEDKTAYIEISPRALRSGELITELVDIVSEESGAVSFTAEVGVKGFVTDLVNISLISGEEKYLVYSAFSGQEVQTIPVSVESGEVTPIRISIEALEQINFGFDIWVRLSY